MCILSKYPCLLMLPIQVPLVENHCTRDIHVRTDRRVRIHAWKVLSSSKSAADGEAWKL